MDHVCPWWGGYFIDNRLRRLLHNPYKILGPYVQPGITVLDFGCGMGGFSIAMADMVGANGKVIAADLQPQMLRVVRKRAAKAGVIDRVQTHQCSRDSIGYDGPLDFVLAFWSAHEVPDLRRFLGESHALLVDGGKMLVAEPRGHVSGRDFQHMVDLADDVGLRLDDQRRIRLSRSAAFVKV